jgi:hypothetical protein
MEGDFTMDHRINSEGGPDGGAPGLGEQILLGAVKLLSLPFFLLAIILMASIYGVTFLARCVAMLAAVSHRAPRRSIPSFGQPERPQDA